MSEPPSRLILAVDDEALVLDIIVVALEDAGYGVVQAGSAAHAISILDEHPSKLSGVITEVDFGDDQLSGWEVARHARALNSTMPIVYVSKGGGHDWARRAVPDSVVLPKPFAVIELVLALTRRLDTGH